jgi:hypothetical protein
MGFNKLNDSGQSLILGDENNGQEADERKEAAW